MKFESKYGVNEICGYNEQKCDFGRSIPDVLVKIIGVIFETDGRVTYSLEYVTNNMEVKRLVCPESHLTGDPAFDQNAGRYPEVIEE